MALYLTKELENGATIYVWDITESEEDLLNLTSIPSEELEDLNLIKNASRRKEKLAVRALLNEIFDDRVYLGHHDNGKPYLQNQLTEISITHSERFVAIITHPFEDVGIDIESLDRDFSAVEKKVLSEEEIDDLSDSERKRDMQLPIYWCAKEAIYKRMSILGVDFAEQIEVERFNPRKDGELEATFIHKDGTELDFELEYMIFDNHIMVWLVG
ncbi:MAG: 4'-phosphopantetheinyl transferase superfamily protein [Bacteroidales bacterium]|nr:4'-phosphopantetheinyl transferase superfamily protein [Bacteroidales bacterium]